MAKIEGAAAALQKKIDQYLKDTLARNQALRDRLADLEAKAAALKARKPDVWNKPDDWAPKKW